jgi:hypothetical protein
MTIATLINVFEVPADREEEFLSLWEDADRLLRFQGGYVVTRLHGALMPRYPLPVRERSRAGLRRAVARSDRQRRVPRSGRADVRLSALTKAVPGGPRIPP